MFYRQIKLTKFSLYESPLVYEPLPPISCVGAVGICSFSNAACFCLKNNDSFPIKNTPNKCIGKYELSCLYVNESCVVFL